MTLVGAFLSSAFAGNYTLTDGREFSGEPITIKDDGIILKSASGTYSPRLSWDKLTQEALKTLLSEARTPNERAMIEPLIDEPTQLKSKPQEKEVSIKPVIAPSRPTQGLGLFALFSSPLGLVIFVILYAATIFAGYEVAIYRDQPIGLVCGLAGIPFIGIVSPIAFMLMKKGHLPVQESAAENDAAPEPVQAAPELATSSLAPAPDASSSAPSAANPKTTGQLKPGLPAPIVYKKGDFSFNRRFFETKLAAFQRLVPSGADKDMVVWIKSLRGDFTGRRIVQINANDLHLQIFKADATADEMIPFVEILEVQIRHKDIV